jgi:tetratricopeptide (TPR) repeat protein
VNDAFRAELSRRTGLRVPARRSHRLADRVTRQDGLFSALADWAMDHPHRLEGVRLWARQQAAQSAEPGIWEVYGYLSYLAEDWSQAAQAFLRSLEADPENLDAWTDLAFSLIHLGLPLGEAILWNHDRFIELCAEEPGQTLDLFRLQRLWQKIQERGLTYEQEYRRWLP